MDGKFIVPSRCYVKPSTSRPLDGARISVKDNIDIAGHKTSLGNRSWLEFYPAKTKNAVCVQTLIDAGAIIVGKVKLQAMIMREEPLECVEFTAPFNPRADGYQVPSGSSHASAAGISSYDWLDFSLGSDSPSSKSLCRVFPANCGLSQWELSKTRILQWVLLYSTFNGSLELWRSCRLFPVGTIKTQFKTNR